MWASFEYGIASATPRDVPVNVELVKIRTIFELTGGKVSSEPANIKSTVLSSILVDDAATDAQI